MIQTKQGGYECYLMATHQVITQPYVTVIPATPAIIATIDAHGKYDSIQNLKITNLCRHLLYDSSMHPALLAGLDDADDEDKDTCLAGVHDEDTSSLAGVPVPNTTIMTNADDESDAESDHNSVDPNEASDNSSKASVHSTGSHICVHSVTSEPAQHHQAG